MKIVIVGPGAMGSLLAALLADGGREVWLLGRNSQWAAAIARLGLTIEGPEGVRRVHPRFSVRADAIGLADVLMVCVKAGDTAAALRHARAATGGHTVLVSFQNGVGNLEILAAHAGADRTVCAVTALGALLTAPGRVRQTGFGPTTLAPLLYDHSCADGVAAVFARAGLAVRRAPDGVTAVWGKLVVSAAINPLTALYGVSNGAVAELPELRALAVAAAREVWNVARAKGLELPFADPVDELLAVCRFTRDNRSSMLRDVEARRRTEVRAINGAVVAEARALGLPAPVNELLLRRILEREAVTSR